MANKFVYKVKMDPKLEPTEFKDINIISLMHGMANDKTMLKKF